jgi:hypothetical protein
LAVTELTPVVRDEMFALMDEHYDNVQRHVFATDLAEKRWAILVHDPATARLCGFTTLTLLDAEVDGRPVKALFSGDTIIHRDCWGDHALSRIWGRFVFRLMEAHADEEFYWFLISQGYKTYRYLPIFFHEFYPRYDAATPGRVRAVLDTLARQRYAGNYDATAGVIRATPCQYRLRAGVADVTAERLRDLHVRFFQTRNAGHPRGDELCCLAALTPDNFTRAAYRVIRPELMPAETS